MDPNEEAYEDLLVREFRKSLYDDEDLELLREARYASRIESLIKSILQPALRATTQFASSRSGLHHSCVLTLNHPVPSPSPLPPSITPQIEQKEAAAGLAPDAPRPREAPAGVAAGEIRIPATAASLSGSPRRRRLPARRPRVPYPFSATCSQAFQPVAFALVLALSRNQSAGVIAPCHLALTPLRGLHNTPIFPSTEELFLRTELKAGGASVRTVEHLLAALEALGVDNARVEVQGSGELPILDGSAAAWAEQVMLAGVGSAATAQGKALPRMVPAVSRQVTVTDGEAFVSFTPDERPRLSAGIDFTRLAPVIGRQWATWSPLDEEHFYDTVALARTFTIDLVHEDLLKRGFCKGGSYDCALVASERYYINGPERMRDEPAHHKLLDLVGDLSLLAEGGNGGLPLGHVVSYKAGHTLHARFVRAMKEAMGEAGGAKMVPTPQFEMRAASAAGAAFQMQWEGGGEQFSRDDLL